LTHTVHFLLMFISISEILSSLVFVGSFVREVRCDFSKTTSPIFKKNLAQHLVLQYNKLRVDIECFMYRAAFSGSRCLEIPTLDFPSVRPSQTTRFVFTVYHLSGVSRISPHYYPPSCSSPSLACLYFPFIFPFLLLLSPTPCSLFVLLPGCVEQSTSLLAGVKAGRVHLCRVAGNTM